MAEPMLNHPKKTPLEERLIALIEDHGPIQIGDFMADALGHPQHGYYMTQSPFGTDGDFITAPEISQIFGELIGAWLIQSWEDLGAPSLFNLIEFGPGRGTLMADILRVAKLRPKFLKAARIYLIETSGRLRYEQTRRLTEFNIPITWAAELHDIPAAPTLAIANEFFDCLPIRQFVRTAQHNKTPWRERLVGLNGPDKTLCFTLSQDQFPDPDGVPSGVKPEDIFETCPAAQNLIREIASRLLSYKGRCLIIDYGHGRSGFGDTFQALNRHTYRHPLAQPGLQDVTAHVDFAALARVGRESGLLVHGPELQGRFLSRLGLQERAHLLQKNASEEQIALLVSATNRLVDDNEMGRLFKALSLSSPELNTPAGF
ncbi:MAG: class I SAM-dependent methyltransferase [bacterium]